MRLSRTDIVPVLTIVAGGAIGGSLSFSFLGSRSEDVSVAVPVSATYESVEVFLQRERFKEALRLQERDRMEDEVRERAEVILRARIDAVEARLGLRDEPQEVGWDVTSQPPVFWLPEIQQRQGPNPRR